MQNIRKGGSAQGQPRKGEGFWHCVPARRTSAFAVKLGRISGPSRRHVGSHVRMPSVVQWLGLYANELGRALAVRQLHFTELKSTRTPPEFQLRADMVTWVAELQAAASRGACPVPYTPLTLPTSLRVVIAL